MKSFNRADSPIDIKTGRLFSDNLLIIEHK